MPYTTSSGSEFWEIFQTVRCSLKSDDFIPRSFDLLSIMIAQGENKAALTKKQQNIFHCYPNVFQKFGIVHEEINISIIKNS